MRWPDMIGETTVWCDGDACQALVLTRSTAFGPTADAGKLCNGKSLQGKQTKMSIKLNLVFYKKANLFVVMRMRTLAGQMPWLQIALHLQLPKTTKTYANDFFLSGWQGWWLDLVGLGADWLGWAVARKQKNAVCGAERFLGLRTIFRQHSSNSPNFGFQFKLIRRAHLKSVLKFNFCYSI